MESSPSTCAKADPSVFACVVIHLTRPPPIVGLASGDSRNGSP